MAKRSTILRNWPKYLLQWGVLGAIIVFLTGIIPSETAVDPEAYCPMGGLQALATYLANNSLPCSMSSLQVMMGIALVAAVVLLGIVIAVAAGSGEQDGPLTPNEAKKIVLQDLGISESKADSVHAHTTTENGKACYLIYVTVDGENWEYIVDGFSGEILKKAENDHGHTH